MFNKQAEGAKPPQYASVDNIFVFIRQVTALFSHVGYLKHQQQVELWSFDLKVVSELHVLCRNLSLPRPLRSRLRPDERDR